MPCFMKIDGIKGGAHADAAFDFAIPTAQTTDQAATFTAIALAESGGSRYYDDASFLRSELTSEPAAPLFDSSAVATMHNLEFDFAL